MIGEIDPFEYDCKGRVVSFPTQETVPLRDRFLDYLAGDLSVRCNSLGEIQDFLGKCHYVSDADQFGVEDYWMHPRHFERIRRGDCEDFALWTWRQLLAMGFEARFVMGECGRGHHAWVTFSDSERQYLFEATARRRRKLSRLEVLMHKPSASVSFHGNVLVCYIHDPHDYEPTPSEALALVVKGLMFLPVNLMAKIAQLLRRLIFRWLPTRRTQSRKRRVSSRLRSSGRLLDKRELKP